MLSDGFNQIVLSSMVREEAEHSDDSRLSSMADVDCKGRTSMVFSMMDQGRISNVECDSRSFTMMYNDGPKSLAVAAVGTAWGCASLEDLVPPALNVLLAKVLRPDTESDSKKQSVQDSSSADVVCTAPADRSNDSCMTRMLLRLLALESSAHALLFGEFMGLIFARALLLTVTLQIEGQVPVSDLECDVCNHAAPSSPGRGDA